MAGTTTRIAIANFTSDGLTRESILPERAVAGVIAGTGRQPVPCGETGTRLPQESARTHGRLERTQCKKLKHRAGGVS